jgi:hypothetical protein
MPTNSLQGQTDSTYVDPSQTFCKVPHTGDPHLNNALNDILLSHWNVLVTKDLIYIAHTLTFFFGVL